MRYLLRLAIVPIALFLLSACGSGTAQPTATPVPSPTLAPKTYIIATSEGMTFLRRVAAAYEAGDSSASVTCSKAQLQLALDDLHAVVGSGDLPFKTDGAALKSICDSADADGWASVRASVLHAIGQ